MNREWECHNCGRTEKHDEDELPTGWRWLGLAANLDGIFDQLETPLLCKACIFAVFVAVEECLQKRKMPGPTEAVIMAITVRRMAEALESFPVKVDHETLDQFFSRLKEWHLVCKDVIEESGNRDWIRRIRGTIEGRTP